MVPLGSMASDAVTMDAAQTSRTERMGMLRVNKIEFRIQVNPKHFNVPTRGYFSL